MPEEPPRISAQRSRPSAIGGSLDDPPRGPRTRRVNRPRWPRPFGLQAIAVAGLVFASLRFGGWISRAGPGSDHAGAAELGDPLRPEAVFTQDLVAVFAQRRRRETDRGGRRGELERNRDLVD